MKNKFLSVFVVLLLLCVCCVSFPTVQVSAAGSKVLYVASDGTGDGLSESSPMSLFKLNSTMLYGGDTVLFRRGDIFYGSFLPITYNTTNTKRVDVGAYGEGALPILSNAKIIKSSWSKSGNFYMFNLGENGKYDGVQNKDANVGYLEDAKGVKHGIRCKDAASCKNEYDFYINGSRIYVKSSKDPYAALGALTVNTHADSLIRIQPNMDFHDLHIRDAGYGICWAKGTAKNNVSIKNCVFDNIGGCVIDEANFTKAGNAIELYDGGVNVQVERNVFRDTYDVAFTCQGHGGSNIKNNDGIWRNITVKENVFVTNTQALEIWSGAASSGNGVNNLLFIDNILLNQGEGWGTDARPGKLAATDILAYGYNSPIWKMTISNNTMFHNGAQGAAYVMPQASLKSLRAKTTIDKNHYYFLNASVEFARWGEAPAYSYSFEQWQQPQSVIGETSTTVDANSKFTLIGSQNSKYQSMLKVASESFDLNEIVKAVKDTGLHTPIAVSNTTTTSKKTTTTTTAENRVTTTTKDGASPTKTGTKTTASKTQNGETQSTSDVEVTLSTQSNDANVTTTEVNSNVTPRDDGGNGVWLIVIGGIVLVAVAVLVTVLLIRRKQMLDAQEMGENDDA